MVLNYFCENHHKNNYFKNEFEFGLPKYIVKYHLSKELDHDILLYSSNEELIEDLKKIKYCK